MSLEVIKMQKNELNLELFKSVRSQVYESDSLGLLQSDEINFDFLSELIVILQDQKAVGRIAVYNNPDLKWNEELICPLGNFECVNDSEVARLLFDEAFKSAKKLGFTQVIGPMNGSTWDAYRFSLSNHFSNFLSEPFHPIYYNSLFQEAGFKVILNYQSKRETKMILDHEKVKEKLKSIDTTGITIRELDVNDLDAELRKLFPLVKDAFSSNKLYTPISFEHFHQKYAGIIERIGSRYVMLAEKNGEVIAFVFAFPDLYDSSGRQIVFKTVARKYGVEFAGVGHLIAHEVTSRAVSDGMESGIHAFMIYDATSTEISKNFASEAYKEYVLYAKQLK